MEYLFQYPVRTDLFCEKEQVYSYGDLQIILALRDEYIYTPSKKVRIIASADKPFNALKAVHRIFHNFFDLFIVYTIDNFQLGPLEIILQGQKGSRNRILMYDLIDFPDGRKDFLSKYNIQEIQNVLSIAFDPKDSQCLYYLSRAVQASHIYDKFLNVIHALESISIKSKGYRACNKCKSLLRCPACHIGLSCDMHSPEEVCEKCKQYFKSTTQFERITREDLGRMLDKIGDTTSDPEELLKLRNLCAHPGKKGRIDYRKVQSYTHTISFHINYYLCSKYSAYFGGGGVYLSGMHTGFWQTTFNTSKANDDFALDVPRMIDLKNSNRGEPARF